MKKYFVFLVLAFIFCGCTSSFSPITKANMVLDGEMQQTATSDGHPLFSGYVKNSGSGVGYNTMIEVRCYINGAKNGIDVQIIIDTAEGFPADHGDITPGQRAYFEAIAFNLNSQSQIDGHSYKITWLDR